MEPDGDAVPSGGGAELMPATPPSSPPGDENRDPSNGGASSLIDVSDAAEIKQLEAKVEEYQSEIEANAAVIQALRDALARSLSKVMNLFKKWDVDHDGRISKKEFRKAIPNMGFDAPREHIDELFDEVCTAYRTEGFAMPRAAL